MDGWIDGGSEAGGRRDGGGKREEDTYADPNHVVFIAQDEGREDMCAPFYR